MSWLLDSGVRTARVAHECDECSHTIHPGDQYRFSSEADFGTVITTRVCSLCYDLILDLFNAGIVGTDQDGNDCLPFLGDVDRDEVPDDLIRRFDAWQVANGGER